MRSNFLDTDWIYHTSTSLRKTKKLIPTPLALPQIWHCSNLVQTLGETNHHPCCLVVPMPLQLHFPESPQRLLTKLLSLPLLGQNDPEWGSFQGLYRLLAQKWKKTTNITSVHVFCRYVDICWTIFIWCCPAPKPSNVVRKFQMHQSTIRSDLSYLHRKTDAKMSSVGFGCFWRVCGSKVNSVPDPQMGSFRLWAARVAES